MPRPKIHDEELRRRLLRAAGRMVAEHGVDALTLRRIAADENTSTTAIYSLFGGRSELISALFVEAFRSFGAAQYAVATSGDTATDLADLGIAYRAWGLANPHLYAVMFSGALGDFALTDDQMAECRDTMIPLWRTVAAGLDRGVLTGGTADQIAHAFWAMVHGLVSLELTATAARPPTERAALFDGSVSALLRGWTPDHAG